MSAFNYTAQRNLISGHSVGVDYDIEAGMEILTAEDKEVINQQISLGGSTDTLFHRVDEIWTLRTVGLGDDANGDFAEFREFLTSVMSGEAFTFDAYGTIASADNIQNAVLVPKSFKRKRVSNISQSSIPTWSAAFRIRII